ncbi:MAG: phosphate-starvation-inducible PsiE family protein [Deltaproteobacteria bacterium]|nr:phosphate-starvation-inducible PsiE family protein [Deltaproteobacteria bacterium]
MIEVLKKFERYVVIALIVMMMIVVLVATVELGWIIIKDIMNPPMFLLVVADLLEIFGFFMLVLIGIELLETIKAYLVENVVHVEIVLEVALIAIARKAIILDIENYESLTILGTAGLILAVAIAYYAVKRRIIARHV